MKKIMKKLFVLTFFVPIPLAFSNLDFKSKSNADVFVDWNNEFYYEKSKKVFVDCFNDAYQGLDIKKDLNLKENSLNEFLDRIFKEDVNNKENLKIAQARIGHQVVGYASFEQTSSRDYYLSLLAVDPAYQKEGIGKKLVFSILDLVPDCKKIHLETREVNKNAIQFYGHIGFKIGSASRSYYIEIEKLITPQDVDYIQQFQVH